MNEIYLIEKTWIDNLENNNAWGYSPIGFVETVEEADKIVNDGGRHKKGDCWEMNIEVNAGIKKEFPTKYRYKKIKKVEGNKMNDEELKVTYGIDSNKIFSEIISSDINIKSPFSPSFLGHFILIAEDADFTIEQSKILSPWLLNFAQKHKESKNEEDIRVVYSAIRTGASMLYPQDTDCLLPLLDFDNSNRTVLVTTKMVGRIFEANPPTQIDQYVDLANKIKEIAEPLLCKNINVDNGDASLAQLSIHALICMGSTNIYPILENVIKMKESWFNQQILHQFKELKDEWEDRQEPVVSQLINLLNNVIQKIKKEI